MRIRRAIRLLTYCLFILDGKKALWADELSFNTIYRSPYYLGRGDTGIATADNFEAIFYNPAGLAQGKGLYKETVLISPTIDMSIHTKDLVRQVVIEQKNDADTLKTYVGQNMHVGFSNFSGIIFRRMAAGVLVSSTTNIMLAKSVRDRGLETLHAEATANRLAVLSVAESFWNQKLMLGITGKYLMRNEAKLEVSALDSENISDQLAANNAQISRNGAGVDFGIMYDMEKLPWQLGLHIENFGSTKLKAAEAGVSSRRLPQIVSVGSAFEMGTKVSSMTVLADFRDIGGTLEQNAFKRLHLGAELKIAKIFGFIGGLNQGYPTAGLFLNLYVMRMDFGVYTEEIGNTVGIRPDQRLYFRLKAGF